MVDQENEPIRVITLVNEGVDLHYHGILFRIRTEGVLISAMHHIRDTVMLPDFEAGLEDAKRVFTAWKAYTSYTLTLDAYFDGCRKAEDFTERLRNEHPLSNWGTREAKRIIELIDTMRTLEWPFNLTCVDESYQGAMNFLYPNQGYVYLIKSLISPHWKIGKTRDIADRTRTFNVVLPFEVELEHVIKCNDYHAAEKQLHQHYAHCRVRGEWFALTPDDVTAIKSIERL